MGRNLKGVLSGLVGWLLLGCLLVLLGNQPLAAQSGVSNFTSIVASRDITAGDDLAVGGDAAVDGFWQLTPATAITVTMNGIITPTGSYQPLTAAGAVGTASIATAPAGTALYLVNTVNQTITLTDTGTLKLGGNRALGQFDTLTLVSDGTNWVEQAFANN